MRTMGFSFVPVAVNKQAPAMKAASVQFQGIKDSDSAEAQVVTRRLDELSAAVAGKKVKLVAANPSKYEMTLDIDGKKFVLSGFGAPRMGTMPQQFSLKSLETGETISYTGHGCFSPPSVGYKAPSGAAEMDRFYGEEAYKAVEVLTALKDAVGG